MFDFLFKRQKYDPPTDKQINYARKLGIKITYKMSKQDVSHAIDEAKASAPPITETTQISSHTWCENNS